MSFKMNFKNSFLFLRSATLCVVIQNYSSAAPETHGGLCLGSKQALLWRKMYWKWTGMTCTVWDRNVVSLFS